MKREKEYKHDANCKINSLGKGYYFRKKCSSLFQRNLFQILMGKKFKEEIYDFEMIVKPWRRSVKKLVILVIFVNKSNFKIIINI